MSGTPGTAGQPEDARDAQRNGRAHSEIVHAIVTLARTLGMGVAAEGLETAEQVSHLRSLSCEFGQGYFFSKPIDSLAAGELIADRARW